MAPRLEGRQRARLIVLHETAVADHVGGEDGGEAALDAFFGHKMRLPFENAVPSIVLGP